MCPQNLKLQQTVAENVGPPLIQPVPPHLRMCANKRIDFPAPRLHGGSGLILQPAASMQPYWFAVTNMVKAVPPVPPHRQHRRIGRLHVRDAVELTERRGDLGGGPFELGDQVRGARGAVSPDTLPESRLYLFQ